ncbi:hypothetical protein PPACK8108_LOCUS14857 [Phakopsora pachyrhizi]|uniref:Uncharacterized protein n=1 Tax=Phakopsora pachyrhizi TaxID=170000 RepID=A0AAV0B7N2_PHAPC|nr:hypothetical protein PPACK8108_LOCUS14857 [Phakopsora pachyrhizi]
MPSNSPEMTNLKVTETSNFNQASSTTLEEDPYIKRGNKSIHTETGKHLNNALQSPTQSPRMTRLSVASQLLLKLSTPFILTGPSESSASKPYHLVHQQNSGCWKLEQPGWLWENHLSTLCSTQARVNLGYPQRIYQVRGLGDGQGLGLTDQVVILHWGDPRHCGWPDLTGAIRLQQSGDPQSVLVSLPSGMVSDLLELLPSNLVATCQNLLTECLPTRASVRQQQGTLSETFFRQRLRGLRSLSQPSNSTPWDGEDLLPAVVLSAHYNSKAGFGDLFAPAKPLNQLQMIAFYILKILKHVNSLILLVELKLINGTDLILKSQIAPMPLILQPQARVGLYPDDDAQSAMGIIYNPPAHGFLNLFSHSIGKLNRMMMALGAVIYVFIALLVTEINFAKTMTSVYTVGIAAAFIFKDNARVEEVLMVKQMGLLATVFVCWDGTEWFAPRALLGLTGKIGEANGTIKGLPCGCELLQSRARDFTLNSELPLLIFQGSKLGYAALKESPLGAVIRACGGPVGLGAQAAAGGLIVHGRSWVQ